SASRVGVGSALCVALNVTSTRFRSGFSFRCRTSSCIGYRSIRRKTSRVLDFAVSSARTTTTPWDGMPYRTAADGGARAKQTRSSVQKSPTVTTGLACPIVGKMLGPCTRAPIGHRRYSRRDSGSRNLTSANSANAEGELPVDMDAHLLRDLGPLVVHDDDVPL